MAIAPARDASTLVLVRDAAGGPEALLLERHPGSRFAPGAFAFPGGRLEPEDAPPDAERLCQGLTPEAAARILQDVAPAARAIGFWIAALREAFEETGLLLAYGRDGAPFVPDAAGRARLVASRARGRAEAAAFGGMLGEEGLTLATDRMVYYAHWITPEARPLRYDTRFFVAAAFDGATPEPDGQEIVAFRWLAPAAALDQHRSRAITLPFPTQQILRSLADHADVATLLRAAAARDVRPVLPRVVRIDGREQILLPEGSGFDRGAAGPEPIGA